MAPQEWRLPGTVAHSQQPAEVATVDTDRVHAPEQEGDILETHYSSLERLRPHACYDGWIYLGFEGEDENGEHVEEIERVPCRRCASAADEAR